MITTTTTTTTITSEPGSQGRLVHVTIGRRLRDMHLEYCVQICKSLWNDRLPTTFALLMFPSSILIMKIPLVNHAR